MSTRGTRSTSQRLVVPKWVTKVDLHGKSLEGFGFRHWTGPRRGPISRILPAGTGPAPAVARTRGAALLLITAQHWDVPSRPRAPMLLVGPRIRTPRARLPNDEFRQLLRLLRLLLLAPPPPATPAGTLTMTVIDVSFLTRPLDHLTATTSAFPAPHSLLLL